MRRRASVFGTVVNVHIPKPKRLTNRFNRMVHNVGYGFVQFATVKAAKRFIFVSEKSDLCKFSMAKIVLNFHKLFL